ncbi:hypothetical protein Pan189_18290 [Stratiformator vulcanicus]|uniref:Uncharacterized protein n=1 Tax=Stratiformator vulcanicus TaxID=2527980 RepID=A0A517R0N7_9PLAN|nr:hypothetical protein Pan189_18290 [Stratiformator vulcanicus]
MAAVLSEDRASANLTAEALLMSLGSAMLSFANSPRAERVEAAVLSDL